MAEDKKEITLEEAKSIADKYLNGITHCTEYPDAFWFSNEKSALSLGGGNSPVIVLKESGEAVNAVTYVERGDGRIIREIDYRMC